MIGNLVHKRFNLLRADVFVYNGLGMESYVDQIMESGEFDNVLFVKASEGVELLEFEDDHGGHDDHAKEGHDDHDEHDSHAEEFYEEIALVIEEFEHGHMTESKSLKPSKKYFMNMKEMDMIMEQVQLKKLNISYMKLKMDTLKVLKV